MPIGVLSSYTAKIELQFNKTCLKRGGNCLKKTSYRPSSSIFLSKILYGIQIKILSLWPIIRALGLIVIIK